MKIEYFFQKDSRHTSSFLELLSESKCHRNVKKIMSRKNKTKYFRLRLDEVSSERPIRET